MKQFLRLILCLALCCALAPAAAEDLPLYYASDFSEGTDGWYARSEGEATISVTASGALKIEGRTAA